VTQLQTCLQLVKKKLKSGSPTVDILDAVVAGEDGPISEKAKSILVKIQSSARLSNNYDNKCTDIKTCRHCEKIERLDGAKLMKCQRCKVTYYCSKKCQVADWKCHKKMCKVMCTADVSPSAQKTSHLTMRYVVASGTRTIIALPHATHGTAKFEGQCAFRYCREQSS
jgi:hypothetical protein